MALGALLSLPMSRLYCHRFCLGTIVFFKCSLIIAFSSIFRKSGMSCLFSKLVFGEQTTVKGLQLPSLTPPAYTYNHDPKPPPGAGSAKLSYVLLKKLLKLAEYLPRRQTSDNNQSPGNNTNNNSNNSSSNKPSGGFCFKYVITDFSHSNFGFWMNHPRLQELFALGIVDFAVFDAEAEPGSLGGKEGSSGDGGSAGGGDPGVNDQGRGVGLWRDGCLRLELSGQELRPGDMKHPVIVVANYVFDSLKQDAFR